MVSMSILMGKISEKQLFKHWTQGHISCLQPECVV